MTWTGHPIRAGRRQRRRPTGSVVLSWRDHSQPDPPGAPGVHPEEVGQLRSHADPLALVEQDDEAGGHLLLVRSTGDEQLAGQRHDQRGGLAGGRGLSLIHISEPTRLLSISYAVFCLKKKNTKKPKQHKTLKKIKKNKTHKKIYHYT